MEIAGRDRYRGNANSCWRGSSLVEVSVALLILGLVVIPLINLFRAGNSYSAAARRQLAAVSLAQAVMEEIEALPPDRLGRVRAATSTTVTLEQGDRPRLAEDVFYLVAVTGGEGSGGVGKLSTYDEQSGTITVATPWSTLPQPGDSLMLIPDRGFGNQVAVTCQDEPLSSHLLRVRVTVSYRQQGEVKKLSLVTAKLVNTL